MTDREMLMELIAKVMVQERKIAEKFYGDDEKSIEEELNERIHYKKNGDIILVGNNYQRMTLIFDKDGNLKKWR